MPRQSIITLLAATAVLATHSAAIAQEPTPPPSGPVYVVQANETLSTIADKFDVDINALANANGITDPDLISEGARLIIPGLEGVNGILETEIVAFGDSFRSVVRRTRIPIALLQKLNHVVSPTEFYVGAAMIVPQEQDLAQFTNRLAAVAQRSTLETAILGDTDAWTLAAINGLSGTWDGLPGDSLFTSGAGSDQALPTGLPTAFVSAEIRTLPLRQGSTAEIVIFVDKGVVLSGALAGDPLHFFRMDDGGFVGLQGIHALLPPGVYPLQLDAQLPDGTMQSFQQSLVISDAGFPRESLTVPAESIDPAVTAPESDFVQALVSGITETRRWSGPWILPVAEPHCVKDWFGTRRSFNLSDYDYFHAGIDYGICSPEKPFDIYAAAPGTVVFSGPLTVRGNATFIDHGWGIYSAYFHQVKSLVSVGQDVAAGDLIGQIGETGRVTGPHLHFEVWAGGVQVDPQAWLLGIFP